MDDDFLNKEVLINDRKIMVGVPSYDGKILVDTVAALFNFQRELNKYGAEFGIVSCIGNSLVTEARNEIVHDFLNNSAGTDLFFLDTDVVFNLEDAMRLVMWATNHDIVSGVYPRKQLQDNGTASFDFSPFTDENGYIVFNENKLLIKSHGSGIGFTNIRRHVLEKLYLRNSNKCYKHRKGGNRIKLFDVVVDNGVLIGEDYYFFRSAIDAGFDCWVDPYCDLQHIGSKPFTGSVLDVLQREENNATNQQREKDIKEYAKNVQVKQESERSILQI